MFVEIEIQRSMSYNFFIFFKRGTILRSMLNFLKCTKLVRHPKYVTTTIIQNDTVIPIP